MKKPDKGVRDELDSLSPLLASLHEKHREILTPPPGYFDKLPDEAMLKIRALSTSDIKKTSRPSKGSPKNHLSAHTGNKHTSQPPGYLSAMRKALAFASVVLLIFAGRYLLRPEKATSADCAEIKCLTPSEVQDYVQHNIHHFPLDIILEAASAEAALNTLLIPVPSAGKEELVPVLNELFQHLDPQEYESLF